MSPPDLDRLFETFVRIGPCTTATFDSGHHIHVLRRSIVPVIKELRSLHVADWISLMIHDDRTFRIGNPPRGDALWHLRLSLHPSATAATLAQTLPAVFESTRPVPRASVAAIPGLDTSLQKSQSILGRWLRLGKYTEWLIEVLDDYREDADPAAVARDLRQFAHLIVNSIYPEIERVRG